MVFPCQIRTKQSIIIRSKKQDGIVEDARHEKSVQACVDSLSSPGGVFTQHASVETST